MAEEHKTVFISYRRSVGSDAARAVFLDLRHHGYDVFLDVDSINSGQFDTIILRQIEARAHFVLILTPGTVERCADQRDWLRREIEYAMETQRNIVLLMYRDFSFTGTEKYLTGKLTELPRYNGMTVPHDYFDAAMDKLRSRFLIKPAYGVVKPAPASDQTFVQRKIEEAVAQPAPSEAKLSAEDYFNMAMALNDNSEQEIAYYTDAIRLNPQYAAAYNSRGVARAAQGDLNGAITDYTEAIQLNPQYSAAYNNRGIARRTQGDLNGALADYDEAIRLNPQYAEAYNNRGNARRLQGDLKGAFADHTRSIELKNPELHLAYNNRGVARYDMSDLNGAIADYDEAIRLNPQYTEAYNNRGVARQAQGNLNGALADYDEAIQLNPQYAEAYNSRGSAHRAQGDLIGAIADYDEAIRLNPRYVDAYYNRGTARREQGDLSGAIADYQKYLELGGGRRDGDQDEVEQRIRDLQAQLGSQP